MVARQEDADGPGIAATADRLLVEFSGLAVLRMVVQLDDHPPFLLSGRTMTRTK